ncbi:MAG TPA: hypothetical protein VEL74_17970 [Thermoanaerobaculia bacterium]|nr:hypothetical protein [Thermoanaerobaculia bacterium]
MATLNIKNFPEPLYRKLQEQAERDHRSMAQEVIHLLEKATETSEPVSLLELRGLGKECWAGVDAVEYIRRERDSWDS